VPQTDEPFVSVARWMPEQVRHDGEGMSIDLHDYESGRKY